MVRLASLFALAALFSGCVETSLIYNPSTYQSGKTSGRDQTKIKTNISLASTTKSSDYTDNESVHDSIVTHWSSDPGVEYVFGIAHGFSDRFDLGGTLAIGFNGAPFNSLELRPYGKLQLTKPAGRFALSVMPALCFAAGSSDKQSAGMDQAQEEIRSHATALELHLPMSLQTGAHSALTWTPHLIRLTYTAEYEHGAGTTVGPYKLSSKLEKSGVGLSVGWIWRGIHPEATIIGFDGEKPLYSVGIGAHP